MGSNAVLSCFVLSGRAGIRAVCSSDFQKRLPPPKNGPEAGKRLIGGTARDSEYKKAVSAVI